MFDRAQLCPTCARLCTTAWYTDPIDLGSKLAHTIGSCQVWYSRVRDSTRAYCPVHYPVLYQKSLQSTLATLMLPASDQIGSPGAKRCGGFRTWVQHQSLCQGIQLNTQWRDPEEIHRLHSCKGKRYRGNMKPRQNQFAAGRNAGSSRQHELHPSVGSLPLGSSSLSMKSREDGSPLAPTVATAEKLESFFAEPANAATHGKRKVGLKTFPYPARTESRTWRLGQRQQKNAW
jgi:hypothetical protein